MDKAQFRTCSSSSEPNTSSSQFQRRNSKRSRSNRRRQKSKRNNLHQQNLQDQLNHNQDTQHQVTENQDSQHQIEQTNPNELVSKDLISQLTNPKSPPPISHEQEVQSCIAATRYPLNQYLDMPAPRYHSVQSDGENLRNQFDQ